MQRISLLRSPAQLPFFFTIAVFCFSLGLGSAVSAFGQSRQLSLADILIALRSKKAVIEEKNKILAEAVKERGVTFALTPEIENELGSTGAYRILIDAIRQKTSVPSAAVTEKPAQPAVKPVETKPAPAPDFAFYRKRAGENIQINEFDLAVADLTKAIELKPTDAQTYLERGTVLIKQNKLDLAVADFDKTLELDPKNAAAYFNRGSISEKTGKIGNAIADYDKAVEYDPSNDGAKTSAVRLRDAQAAAVKKIEPPLAPVVETPQNTGPVSVGALNGFALNLASPSYSANDRKMAIQGKITVQITLNEEGKVVSAQATEGHKTLRMAAVDAIRRSKFKPVLIGGKPAEVSGYITFNFVAR